MLTDCNPVGKSDPYVKASVGGEKVHKTSVIKKVQAPNTNEFEPRSVMDLILVFSPSFLSHILQTLDPVWSNESFDVCVTAHQYAQNATANDAIDLRFEIFDKDLLKDEKSTYP